MTIPETAIDHLIAQLFPTCSEERIVTPLCLAGRRYNLVVEANYDFRLSPQEQSVVTVVFRNGDDPMAAAKGKVILKPVNPADNVTSRLVDVSLNGGAAMTLDMINPDTEFDCQEGDLYNVTPKGDVNSSGQGPAGNPVSGTVQIGGGPGTGVPAKQEVDSVAFRAA